jgi:hypothetical protein
MLLLSASVLLVIFNPGTSSAITDLLVGSFIDDGVSALSRGGLEQLPRRQESPDFNAPLFLDSQGKYRVDTFYENQRTVRIYHGRWGGTHAYSDRLETSGAVPFSLYGEKFKGNVSAGYGYRSVDIGAENGKEGIFVSSAEKLEAGKGGIYLRALDRFSLGVALISNQLRSGLEVPVEAEVEAVPYLKAGYKRSYVDFDSSIDVTLSGHSGNIPLKYVEEINELYAVLDYRNIVYVKFANELQRSGNRRVEGKLSLPASVYVVGNYAKREFAGIDQAFTADGHPGGNFQGSFRKSEFRVGVGAALSDTWCVEGNYRHGALSSEGGGIASSSAVASFWPSLLIGDYNYIYAASLSSDQYHLAAQYQGNRFSFGAGFQYLDLKPQAKLDYWRSVLFGLGKTGAGNLNLTTDRVQMIFLSLGLGYRWQNVSVKYAFGQFVPIGSHDTDEKPAQTSSGGGGGGGGSDVFSSIADKINYNPGGNIQRLILTLTF